MIRNSNLDIVVIGSRIIGVIALFSSGLPGGMELSLASNSPQSQFKVVTILSKLPVTSLRNPEFFAALALDLVKR
jgi:hypothetical protein